MRVARADGVALAGFALLLVVFGWQGLTDEDGGLRAVQDHTITLSLSRQLATEHVYHEDFVYPLPAVVAKLALGSLGTAASSLVWMALLVGAGLLCVEAMARLLPAAPPRRRYAAPLSGALALVYCLQWDFRAVNGNTLVLALVLGACVLLARGREHGAGALLAASVALKLYTAPLLPGLALVRRPRALLASVAWLVVLFAVVPVLWFGPGLALHLSGLWVDQVVRTGSPAVASGITAYNVSLLRAVQAVLGEAPGTPSAAAVAWARGLGGLALAAVAVWAIRGRRAAVREADGAYWLTGAGLVLAATLLLSPLAQPHHGVVLWPLAAGIAHGALDPARRGGERIAAAALLGAVCVGLIAAPAGAGKAVALAGAGFALGLAAMLGLGARSRAGDSTSRPGARMLPAFHDSP
jgi:hypothetical protein